MKTYCDGGEAMLETFRSLGMPYLFCCSGSEWASVWEAVAHQEHSGRPGPVYIDVWHETVAVGMATGYALVTQRAQPVLLHAGGGLLQGTMAIQGAQLAGVPLIVFSAEAVTYGERPGVDPGSQWYRNLSIVGGPRGLVQPIVKWSNQVSSIETLYEMVIRTAEISVRPPAGPTYLSVPVEVLLTDWKPPKYRRPTPAVARKVSPAEEIDALAGMLLAAETPLVVTETAGRDHAAFHALVALCELLAIPVVEPQSAVSANFPRTHPMHQGGAIEPFMESADLVLLVNCRAPWYPPSEKPPKARIVVIDEVPQRPHIVYQVLHADCYLEGEVAATLQAAAVAARSIGLDTAKVEARRARLAASHARMQARIAEAETKALADSKSIDPALVALLLRRLSAPDTIFVDETITHSRVVQQHLQLDEPGRYYYVQGGLGLGIAVALGVKLAAKEKPVVLTLGDGTFMFNPVIPSLAAARDQQLPILIVIFTNKQYLSMKFNFLRSYPDGVAVANQRFHGVDLHTQPELSEFAAPFGMSGTAVSRPADLEPALRAGLAEVAAGRTAIVNVMVSK